MELPTTGNGIRRDGIHGLCVYGALMYVQNVTKTQNNNIANAQQTHIQELRR